MNCLDTKAIQGNSLDYTLRRLRKESGIVYIIHDSSIERPTGNSRADQAVPLNPNGTNQHKEKTGVDNCKVLKGGNDPEYLTARIARDRPFPCQEIILFTSY